MFQSELLLKSLSLECDDFESDAPIESDALCGTSSAIMKS